MLPSIVVGLGWLLLLLADHQHYRRRGSVLAQQWDFGDMGFGGGGNKRCKLYTCDKGYEPVPKKKMTFTSPGCAGMSAGGGGANLFFGNTEDENGQPYESCCHEWYACYQICGTSKKNCDDTYKHCVRDKCAAQKSDPDETHTNNAAEECLESANMNMLTLQMSGCKQFDRQQAKACDCITHYGGRHLKAREEALRKFYQLYAPEAVQKVPTLLKKADTSAKLANLLQKLVQKYPAAIEPVEDPQTKLYRQMFGSFGGGGHFADAYNKAGGGHRRRRSKEEDDYDDIEDFDVNEDLGSYGDDDEEEEEEPPKVETKKPKKMDSAAKKKKKHPTLPPVQEMENEQENEEDKVEDEFDQYQEL